MREHQTAMIETPLQVYIFLCETFGVLTFVVILLISIYHFSIIYKYKKASKLDTKLYPSLKLLHLFVIVAVIFNLNLCIYGFDVKSVAICYYGKYGGIPLYSIFKLLLYLILVCRIWVITKEFDEYSYNIRKLKLFCSLLTVWCIINIGLIVTMTEITFIPNSRPICYITPSKIALASISFLDIVAGIVTGYLVIAPAIAVHKKQIKSKRESNMVIITFKLCVLSLIAIVTSIIGLTCIAIFAMPQVFAGTDVIISTLCVIFMYDWNSYMADTLCCLYLWCLPKQSVHLKPTQTTDNLEKNIDMTSTKTEQKEDNKL